LTAYVIGEADITNPAAMQAYGPMIVAAVNKYGGKYLARGARPEVLEGGPAHNILIIEFENAEAARRWYASPEYQAAKAVRQGNSNLRLLLVEDFVKPSEPTR
jgi:uncharacterized protein (DUF1330 family)